MANNKVHMDEDAAIMESKICQLKVLFPDDSFDDLGLSVGKTRVEENVNILFFKTFLLKTSCSLKSLQSIFNIDHY